MRLFIRNRKGQGLVEYALIIALIAVVCIVALGTLGNRTSGKLNQIGNQLQ